ncbi:hypothetical protein V3N99_18420 [Dermatophilaceae bacterium Soc4.6]
MTTSAPRGRLALTARRRWAVVTALVAVLVILPLVVRAFPVAGAASPATALLSRIHAAAQHPYAGYAETTGSLALPVTTGLGDVASLLGGITQQRVWWRGAQDWRSDTLSATGELSARTSPAGTQVFDFEDSDVARTGPDPAGAVRLPRATDTLPPLLADRLLSQATPAQVTSLPSRRVAGRPADGLQLLPNEPLSSIARVDVWADRASGVPLLVEAYSRSSAGAGGGTSAVPAMSSTFLDFTDATPGQQVVDFAPPPGAPVFDRRRLDLAQAIGRVPDTALPSSLLGFPRSASPPGLEGIGQYGRGVTQLAVGELPDRVAGSLRDQLRSVVGVTTLPEGVAVTVGPIGLLVTDPAVTGRTLLVTGTLTPAGLAQVARGLRPGAAS